jgi:eukaryotic-like serine/threonine-protein kinase
MFNPYNMAQIRFELREEIGRAGENSQTYKSYDPQLDAVIVTKKVRKTDLNSPDNFFDESRALYASAHPNVVRVYYACQDDEHIYLAMPFYKMGSVGDFLHQKCPTVREIITIGCQVLSGLHNIHSKGLIHFDVKPDNILLSDRGEALLADFGLAKEMNFIGIAAQDRLYNKMIPPEGTRSDQFSRAFDIYQFGLTLYRMCNGNTDYYRQYEAYGVGGAFDRLRFRNDVRNGNFPDRSLFPAHIPQRLRTIVRKCLEVDPADRYRSAIDVANALSDVEGSILDWHFSQVGDTKTWEKNESGTLLEFRAAESGATECFKTVGAGQRRRVTEGCKARMTDRDIRTFLGAH